jgi:hypothetical protein
MFYILTFTWFTFISHYLFSSSFGSMFRRRGSASFGIRPRILVLIPYTLPLIYEVPPSIHNCLEMLISHQEWMYSPNSLKDRLDRGGYLVRVLSTPRNPEEELKVRGSRLPISNFFHMNVSLPILIPSYLVLHNGPFSSFITY